MNASIISVMLWERERDREQGLQMGYSRQRPFFMAQSDEKEELLENTASAQPAKEGLRASKTADCPPACSGMGHREALS